LIKRQSWTKYIISTFRSTEQGLRWERGLPKLTLIQLPSVWIRKWHHINWLMHKSATTTQMQQHCPWWQRQGKSPKQNH